MENGKYGKGDLVRWSFFYQRFEDGHEEQNRFRVDEYLPGKRGYRATMVERPCAEVVIPEDEIEPAR